MAPTTSSDGPGRIERWRSDRLVRSIAYAAAGFFWLAMAIGEHGWFVAVALMAATLFGIGAVVEWREWRRSGRRVAPVSTLPPRLTTEQQERIVTLLQREDRTAAVRLVREETGAGLLAATRAVDGVAALRRA